MKKIISIGLLTVLISGCATTQTPRLSLQLSETNQHHSRVGTPLVTMTMPLQQDNHTSVNQLSMNNNQSNAVTWDEVLSIGLLAGGLALLSYKKKSPEPKRCYSASGITEIAC